MIVKNELSKIWNRHKKEVHFPKIIHERNYCFCENYEKKELLVLGLNPSFGKGAKNVAVKYRFANKLRAVEKLNSEQHYFNRIHSLLRNFGTIEEIDTKVAYADLFYYRTKKQKKYLNFFLDHIDGITFLQDQLRVTQHLIENVIQPRVIVASSWETMLFLGLFGTEGPSCWLGYELELVKHTESGNRVYEIKGIVNDITLSDQFATKTNLVGTQIICYPDLFENESQPQDYKLLSKEVYSEVNGWILGRISNELLEKIKSIFERK